MDKWNRHSAEDGQKQIAWVMTRDRLSHTLKHKRGYLAMRPPGAQIIYLIESVTCLAVCYLPGQDNINGEHCPQTVTKINHKLGRTQVISLTFHQGCKSQVSSRYDKISIHWAMTRYLPISHIFVTIQFRFNSRFCNQCETISSAHSTQSVTFITAYKKQLKYLFCF